MSGFWNTSDGENTVENATGEYDAGGGNFDPIPDDTNCLMVIDGAEKAKDQSFNEYAQITWLVVKPDQFAGRKIWQKLWVFDPDPRAKDKDKKRDNALRMLANIDAICGGKLAKAGREPDSDDLALALTGKQAVCKAKVWEMDGKEGNWIAAVAPKGGKMEVAANGAASQTSRKSPPKREELDDDSIPF